MNFHGGCCAVIAAAGTSSRMNLNVSKQFIPLCGMPAVVRTILAFEAARKVDSVVIVCRPEDREQMEIVSKGCGAGKVAAIVAGGDTRQRSVAAGIAAVPDGTGWLAIHDGARPLVLPEQIDACICDAREHQASALAVPVKDTIKLIDGSRFIVSTPERKLLWAVQTPQVFERGIYERAIRRAETAGMDYTDDCQLLEHAGMRVHLCPGSYENIKLTTPEDLITAETILRRREGIV
ncbi:MAG: 2-C-methyl-D-erythritol 4-phosphate cytidylyltransferase [Oscillospiraceae bacterium]|nr:2-C-methyl-D-erythritol 4-phosphate cytidylyltransferase [Oscillospiraceae bacterium]MCI1990875.1 2-C-methyl-D-erythritol 4-phosphate cytidylyltransferase [Oscillospiraceae bacterium]MCI2036046.1 2-C-methyl-D-erythritol 4-phosphate cytidylyltransferase [Oscillospiraceae bacterium]